MLDHGAEAAPERGGCDPNLWGELVAALKLSRLFIITAHDANAPYVKVMLSKVDATLAKVESEPGSDSAHAEGSELGRPKTEGK